MRVIGSNRWLNYLTILFLGVIVLACSEKEEYLKDLLSDNGITLTITKHLHDSTESFQMNFPLYDDYRWSHIYRNTYEESCMVHIQRMSGDLRSSFQFNFDIIDNDTLDSYFILEFLEGDKLIYLRESSENPILFTIQNKTFDETNGNLKFEFNPIESTINKDVFPYYSIKGSADVIVYEYNYN